MMFMFGAALLVALALVVVAAPLWRTGRRGQAGFAALFVAGTAIAVYLVIGRPDLGLEPPRALDENEPQDVLAMVEHLAARLEAAPDDPEGWTMLGRAYVLMGRYADAARAFGEALRRTTGEDADLMASFAEARTLSNPDALDGEAGALFERVLELDPDNPRALWYGGLRAETRGDPAVALARWQKLMARDLPPAFRQVVEARMAAIDPSAIAALVSVSIDVAPDLADQLPPEGVLYVFLRPAGESAEQGPPLAARRVEFFEFPATLPLTREDLLRGTSLPDGDYIVTARLSADGDPAPGPGDVEGSTAWNPDAAGSVNLRLDRRRGE